MMKKIFVSLVILICISFNVNVNATIKRDIGLALDTNIVRIKLMADSIWSPVGDAVESDGSSLFMRGKLNSFYRQLWDYKNYNKPIFRAIDHSDWTHYGSSEIPTNYPITGNNLDLCRLIDDDNDSSILEMTGYTTIIIWLEGGELGRSISTGMVTVEVSYNNIDYVKPSEMGLYGEKQRGRIGQELGYNLPIDEDSTNLVFPPVFRTGSYLCYTHKHELQYNNLNVDSTYFFKIKRKPGTASIRLCGALYWSGKTMVIENYAIPGASQHMLISSMYNTLGQNGCDYLIMQSTIFHDRLDSLEIIKRYRYMITQAKRYCTRIIFCACTQVGGVIEDSEAVLGDEEPAYKAGQNLGKQINHRWGFNITKPAYDSIPKYGNIYRVTVGGVDYDMTVQIPRCNAEDFESWVYNNKLIFYNYNGFNIGSVNYPLAATRITGTGKTTFTLNSRYGLPLPFDDSRDLIKNLCDEYGLKFIDLYKVFEDLAIENGETTETEPYKITESSPLYGEYDTSDYENYLSRYFRPNHWNKLANAPVFSEFRDELFRNLPME